MDCLLIIIHWRIEIISPVKYLLACHFHFLPSLFQPPVSYFTSPQNRIQKPWRKLQKLFPGNKVNLTVCVPGGRNGVLGSLLRNFIFSGFFIPSRFENIFFATKLTWVYYANVWLIKRRWHISPILMDFQILFIDISLHWMSIGKYPTLPLLYNICKLCRRILLYKPISHVKCLNLEFLNHVRYLSAEKWVNDWQMIKKEISLLFSFKL